MIFLHYILYAIFITLSFLLTIISPILIGAALSQGTNSSNVSLKVFSKLFDLAKPLSQIFSILYISLFKTFVYILTKLESFFLFIYRKISKLCKKEVDADENTNLIVYEYNSIFTDYYISNNQIFIHEFNPTLKFMKMLTIIAAVGIVTLAYYGITYLILSSVCSGLSDVITGSLSDGISLSSIFSILIDNFPLLLVFFHMSYWFIRLIFQIVFSIVYISIIYNGCKEVLEVGSSHKGENSKFVLFKIKSFNILNISILSFIVLLILLAFSMKHNVGIIASTMLMFNLFNIDISLGTAVVTLGPAVIEQTAKVAIPFVCDIIINNKTPKPPRNSNNNSSINKANMNRPPKSNNNSVEELHFFDDMK
ncbi:MAG: hypothetical protein ACRCWG_15400 [Sarcina sp.]